MWLRGQNSKILRDHPGLSRDWSVGDPAYNPGLVQGGLTGALASWSLNKSRHAASIKSLGRLFHRPTLSGKKTGWYPKVCVYGAWNVKLPALQDVGACVRWSETGMSTRLWTIQYRMVTRAVARHSSKDSQPIRSSIAENTTGTTVHFLGCHRCVWVPYHTWVFKDLSFLHRSWCSVQVMLEESTGFGFLFCLVNMWRPRCVFMEKYASACVTNWGKAGLGWRPARSTTAYQGFSKNRHNPVMVYNDLMIRNITVHNYNKDRSQPVTIQCLYSWVGAPVGRPGWSAPTVLWSRFGL